MPTIYAGTSGFAYPAWKPGFYPASAPATKFLEHYATRLNAVEINYTFRRLPAKSTLENWVQATPAGFVFAVKANMRITHVQRLKNAEAATDLFFRSVDPLRSARRLGPALDGRGCRNPPPHRRPRRGFGHCGSARYGRSRCGYG